MNDYEKQAEDFLKKNQTTCTIKFKEYGSMSWDKHGENRNIYTVRLKTKKGQYSYVYGDSIAHTEGGEKPTSYDVLSCLDTYDHETFSDFCSEFGYSEDSREAERIYKAVKKQFKGLSRIFTEEQIAELSEIR